ncbi:MAG: GEVED domain-containing protein, partial [Pirellulales bacterium]
EQGTFTVNDEVYHTVAITSYPQYDPFDFEAGYDLAIMELDRPVQGVAPSPILQQPPQVGQLLTLVGFGESGSYDIKTSPNAGFVLTTREPIHVRILRGEEISGLVFGKNSRVDFGDAPETGFSYPTTLANNGARHNILAGFGLGAIAAGTLGVDGEPDGQPTLDAGITAAAGDDGNGSDDEDGVAFTTNLRPGSFATIAFTGSAAQDIVQGKVQGFIDFNRDGDWKDDGEQIFTDLVIQSGTPAANSLTFTVPADAAVGPTYARFRISTEAGISDEGPARDGEVEDYLIAILPQTSSLDATYVGVVGDVTLANQNIQEPGSWYAATAALTGRFAVTATYDDQNGDLDILVFDDSGLVAQSAAYADGAKQVEFDSVAGRTYFVQIEGSHADVTLNFMNLIEVNSPVTVVGTAGDDVIRFAAGTETHLVTVNGVDFKFDAHTDTQFFVEGNGGNDAISVVSTGGRDRV